MSEYDAMIIQSYEIPILYCALAGLCNWLFLAGFIVFPGAFSSLQDANILAQSDAGVTLQRAIQHSLPLYMGGFTCITSFLGLLYVFWRVRENYVWLLNRVFMPGMANALPKTGTGLGPQR
ncbi:unnamed protein product [Clonostachys rosea f. rosea IK726]|uniref:Uncharacterized protein n=1 Tax=Clonostachys rosea f. rosea IK726 TaxID=1349383 RepID=A0ACA9UDK4_BIOOC|nr:unnamed protein product [Clonostachys rosea f. rosea IK726]